MNFTIRKWTWTIALPLIAVLVVSSFTPMSEAMQQKEKKKDRPKMTLTQRFEKLAAKPNAENPLIPVAMHALERYLQGAPAQTDIDRIVRGAFARHPQVTRAMMQTAVTNWKTLPASVKNKIVPAELRNLSAIQSLDLKAVGDIYRKKLPLPITPTPNIGKVPRDPKDFKIGTFVKAPEPAQAYPGGLVTLNGRFIPEGVEVVLQSGPNGAAGTARPEPGSSPTKIIFRVPQSLVPGNYSLLVWDKGYKHISRTFPFTIRAPQYTVRFTKMYSQDESNPECNCDEIVSVWAISADDKLWGKKTGEYTHFGDHYPFNSKNYKESDQVVFPIQGTGAVGEYLAIGMHLYEWDAGDAAATEEVLDISGDLAEQLLSSFGAIGAIIGAVLNIFLDIIGGLVALFGGDPDGLGYKELKWNAGLLQAMTQFGSYSGVLRFHNNDDVGSYDISYKVTRTDP
jgi:hypothetical protein